MLDLFRVVLRQLAPKGKDFGWVYIFRDLAVANYTNINSNEYFCPVGYEYKLIVTYLCTDSRCSDFSLKVIQFISTIRSEQFKQDWHGLNDESFSRFQKLSPMSRLHSLSKYESAHMPSGVNLVNTPYTSFNS